ncbi:MAG: peroxiredoxin [Candidatus Heimdallarchaeota archaeon]|nr:peroxiredoxin [Candidatus Heimdallarchaeota archaeon]
MALNKGDATPNFSYRDAEGIERELHDLKAKKIVFFFPRAFTPTCTKEVCSIQENYEDLKQAGVAEIFGISTDSEKKQFKFMEEFGLKFILVSDKKAKISNSYQLTRKKFGGLYKFSGRYTFLINEENVIEEVLNNGIKGQLSKYGNMEKHGLELIDILNINQTQD